jgi:hypothetical protein
MNLNIMRTTAKDAVNFTLQRLGAKYPGLGEHKVPAATWSVVQRLYTMQDALLSYTGDYVTVTDDEYLLFVKHGAL